MSKKTVLKQPKKPQVVSADAIVEEVILVEDPEIRWIQEEASLVENILDEWWGEAWSQIRKTQMGELIDETEMSFEDLEKRQMQKALWNKTVTFSDEDDTPRQVWNEKYFEE